MTDLLPCPFCGAAPEIEDHRTIWAVRCECGVCALGERAPEPDGSEADEYWDRIKRTAIDAWNRRHTPEGWQTVPVEATKEMVEAAMSRGAAFGFGAHYQGALKVAPKPGGE